MREQYPEAHFFGSMPHGGFPKSFAIVTAYNPSRVVAKDENQEADSRLRIRLRELGLDSFPIEGGSVDGSHREAGWGIAMGSPDQALELGREFSQDAIFWIDQGWVHLVEVSEPSPMQRVARWADRWVDSVQ